MATTFRTHEASRLKRFIKNIPVIGAAAKRVARIPMVAQLRRLAFPGSAAYWETRYRGGEMSGSGSYGRLAEFKAEILNEFVRTNGFLPAKKFDSECE